MRPCPFGGGVFFMSRGVGQKALPGQKGAEVLTVGAEGPISQGHGLPGKKVAYQTLLPFFRH